MSGKLKELEKNSLEERCIHIAVLKSKGSYILISDDSS